MLAAAAQHERFGAVGSRDSLNLHSFTNFRPSPFQQSDFEVPQLTLGRPDHVRRLRNMSSLHPYLHPEPAQHSGVGFHYIEVKEQLLQALIENTVFGLELFSAGPLLVNSG
jgi:hypothetical protein